MNKNPLSQKSPEIVNNFCFELGTFRSRLASFHCFLIEPQLAPTAERSAVELRGAK